MSITACHCAILDLHQHAIASDAGVVDQSLERAEILQHAIQRSYDTVLVGCVGDVAAGGDAELRTALARLVDVLCVHIEQRKVGALAREMRRERAADAAPGTGYQNGLATNVH
ncbi:MAG: hypothetical protein JOY74_00285 [Sinobacteraceae bacterium]|nr:hypothetical protein [Nevskiaceae bacterium]